LQGEAIRWAVDSGADVICCSWGPPDGPIGVTADPRHNEIHHLPEHMKSALDYAVTAGRDGLGCVVTFAAGNGNESVDNDKYASYDKVVAIAACNDQGKRCFYSDYGNAIWCAFPSGDSWYGRTTGIWTTDRRGLDGLNVGIDAEGDWAGNYTNSFSGTSSACAGAAGIAALIIQKYPKASWQEVKERMKDCCDKIDNPGAQYDPTTGHSPYLGYGRLNAGKI
jgi:subtilisin family serine protease